MTFVTLSVGYEEPRIGLGYGCFFALLRSLAQGFPEELQSGHIQNVFDGQGEHSRWRRFMTMKVRALFVAAVLATTIWLAGCGHYTCKAGFGDTTCSSSGNGLTQGGNGATQRAFVYTVDDAHGQLAAVGLDVNNSLTFEPVSDFVPPPVFPNDDIDGGLVIVKKTYMYMPVSDGNLYGYAIDGLTGALAVLPNTPLELHLPAFAASPIAADPVGSFLFVGTSSGVYVMSINANDGSLTVTNGGAPFAASGLQPVFMTTDGVGHYLYVADGLQITAFSYSSSSGALTPVGGTIANSQIASTMMMLAGEPSGKYIFGITQSNGAGGTALDNNVYEFAISSGSATGALSSLPPTVSPETPSWLAVSPNGQFVYTFNINDASTGNTLREPIVQYSFSSASGALSSPSPSTNFLSERGVIDQSGTYMFVEGQETGSTAAGVLAIAVGADGTLSSTLPHTGLAGISMAVTDEP